MTARHSIERLDLRIHPSAVTVEQLESLGLPCSPGPSAATSAANCSRSASGRPDSRSFTQMRSHSTSTAAYCRRPPVVRRIQSDERALALVEAQGEVHAEGPSAFRRPRRCSGLSVCVDRQATDSSQLDLDLALGPNGRWHAHHASRFSAASTAGDVLSGNVDLTGRTVVVTRRLLRTRARDHPQPD